MLTQVIEAARAEFKYDKLVATEELRRKSEGDFLAKVRGFLVRYYRS